MLLTLPKREQLIKQCCRFGMNQGCPTTLNVDLAGIANASATLAQETFTCRTPIMSSALLVREAVACADCRKQSPTFFRRQVRVNHGHVAGYRCNR